MQPTEPDRIDLYAATGSSPPDEQLINAHEVSERLGVTKQTVLCWHREGVLPGYRPPGRTRPIRFRWSEIEASFRYKGAAS